MSSEEKQKFADVLIEMVKFTQNPDVTGVFLAFQTEDGKVSASIYANENFDYLCREAVKLASDATGPENKSLH